MIRVIALAAALAVAAPALAIGLGPLAKDGTVIGPRKAFYLTLINSESQSVSFTASAIGYDHEDPAGRVSVFPAQVQLGGYQHRQLLVIANDLAPGETFRFRVCAERLQPFEGTTIHARICSKLTARRVPSPAGARGS